MCTCLCSVETFLVLSKCTEIFFSIFLVRLMKNKKFETRLTKTENSFTNFQLNCSKHGKFVLTTTTNVCQT